MKSLLVFLLTIFVVAIAAQGEEPSVEYLPPVADDSGSGSGALTENGYRYRTVRRLRYRHRRDVSELPSVEYLPPVADAPPPPESASLTDNGYKYRTVRKRKFRYRHRRDVSDAAPNNEYLPPTAEEKDAAPSMDESVVVAPEPEPAHTLGKNGYEYKRVRRVRYRYRHRRSADAAPPSAEYLPPVEYLPPLDSTAPAGHSLGADGYRYRTAKRFRLRFARRH